MRGSAWNSLSQPAAMVQISSHASGTPVTHIRLICPSWTTNTVASTRAIAASIWLATPNSAHSELIPPNGSITP